MKSRFISLGFVLLLLPGLYLDFKAGAQRDRLQTHYKRLARVAGDMEVDDSSKVYVHAIETDDPLHFAWRVHTPANFAYSVVNDGGSSSGSSIEPQDFIAHARFKRGKDGQLERYLSFWGGSSRSSMGSKELADWLVAHQKELRIEQTGAGKAASFEAKEPIHLLTISLPDSLANDPIAQKGLMGRTIRLPVLFDLVVNPPAPGNGPNGSPAR